jgi:large subunit ribosomal protein L3
MCQGLIGKKLGMTSVFTNEGVHVPVTVIEAGPCYVTQIKTKTTDGYDALQLGFGQKKASKVNKPLKGHLEKSGSSFFSHLKEMAVDDPDQFSLGQEITVDLFNPGETVDVVGKMKGRGFSGVIKRHGFSGGKKTHGSKSHRIPGSIGCSAWPSRVLKGKKLPGQYGNTRKTITNLKIIDIRPEDNLILIKGAVPGSKSGLVYIKRREAVNKTT